MLYVICDVILVKDTRDGIYSESEKWRKMLKSRRFRLCWSKIEYMECSFSNERESRLDDVIVLLDGTGLPIRDLLDYIGLILLRNGYTDQLKWRGAIWIFCVVEVFL